MARSARMTFLFAGVLILAFGCGSDDGTNPEATFEELVADAWTAFTSGDYAGAEAGFGEAMAMSGDMAEAPSGRGWARLFLGNFAGSDADFAAGEGLTGSNTVKADLYAGWAFLANAGGGSGTSRLAATDNFLLSNQRVDQALALSPEWTFAHLPGLDRGDLIVLKAENYFALGEFTSSLLEVQSLVGAGFDPDVETPEGQAELATKIEELSFTSLELARGLTFTR